jgi:antitoxin (DNA-binding transcriptional repressor) of toxin-antitoxin stability system
VIAKAGLPIARLVPYEAPRRRIAAPGALQGAAWLAEDFDAPMDTLFDALK